MFHRLLATGVATLLMVSAGMAEEPSSSRKIFPLATERCFVADAKGFRSTAKHRPESFALFNLMSAPDIYEWFPEQRAELERRDAQSANPNVEIAVGYGKPKAVFWQGLSCYGNEDSASTFCGVDCDGGGFNLEQSDKDVLMSFTTSDSVIVQGGCGDDDGGVESRAFGKADLAAKSMTLSSAEPDVCRAALHAARPDFASDSVSLRQRLLDPKVNCLKRRYTSAELAAVPKQNITAISVALLEKPTARPEEGGTSTEFKARLSFKTRDGVLHEDEKLCTASQFEFACGEDFRLRRRDATSARLLAGDYTDPNTGPRPMLKQNLGKDDQIFRLDLMDDAACRAE